MVVAAVAGGSSTSSLNIENFVMRRPISRTKTEIGRWNKAAISNATMGHANALANSIVGSTGAGTGSALAEVCAYAEQVRRTNRIPSIRK